MKPEPPLPDQQASDDKAGATLSAVDDAVANVLKINASYTNAMEVVARYELRGKSEKDKQKPANFYYAGAYQGIRNLACDMDRILKNGRQDDVREVLEVFKRALEALEKHSDYKGRIKEIGRQYGEVEKLIKD